MPFGYVMPASGAPVLVDGLAAVKGGNSAGAQKFIEFLFDDTLRADLAKDYFQIPAVEIAQQPEWLAQLNLKPLDVNWDISARTRPSGSTTGTARSRTRADRRVPGARPAPGAARPRRDGPTGTRSDRCGDGPTASRDPYPVPTGPVPAPRPPGQAGTA